MFRKKKMTFLSYDSLRFQPALRTSICTGEQVAGFRDRQTGKFREDRLIRSPQDLQDFLEEYRITEDPVHIY